MEISKQMNFFPPFQWQKYETDRHHLIRFLNILSNLHLYTEPKYERNAHIGVKVAERLNRWEEYIKAIEGERNR